MSAFRVRRVTLAGLAAGLVVAAELFAMLNAAGPRTYHASDPQKAPRIQLPRRLTKENRSRLRARPRRARRGPPPSGSSATTQRGGRQAHNAPLARRHQARDRAARARWTASPWRDQRCRTVGPHGRLRRTSIRRHERGRQLLDRPAGIAVVGCVGARRLESGDRRTDCLCLKRAFGPRRGFGDEHVAGEGQADTCLRARAGIRR